MSSTESPPTAAQWVAALVAEQPAPAALLRDPVLALSRLRELFSPPHAVLQSLDAPDAATVIRALISTGEQPNLMEIAKSPTPPLADRLALVRAIPSLFSQVIETRLPADVLATDVSEPPLRALAITTYMFWDYVAIVPSSRDPVQRPIDEACLGALEAILQRPHAACQQSALHGLGIWTGYPRQVRAILDAWLRSNVRKDRSLVDFAQRLRVDVDRDVPR